MMYPPFVVTELRTVRSGAAPGRSMRSTHSRMTRMKFDGDSVEFAGANKELYAHPPPQIIN